MGARLGDLLDDPRPLDLLPVLEILLQHDMTRFGHRYLFNHFSSSQGLVFKERGTQIQKRAEGSLLPALLERNRHELFGVGRSGRPAEIALQRADLEVAPKVGLDALRRSDGT